MSLRRWECLHRWPHQGFQQAEEGVQGAPEGGQEAGQQELPLVCRPCCLLPNTVRASGPGHPRVPPQGPPKGPSPACDCSPRTPWSPSGTSSKLSGKWGPLISLFEL